MQSYAALGACERRAHVHRQLGALNCVSCVRVGRVIVDMIGRRRVTHAHTRHDLHSLRNYTRTLTNAHAVIPSSMYLFTYVRMQRAAVCVSKTVLARASTNANTQFVHCSLKALRATMQKL